MKQAIIRTVLHFILAVSVAISLTLTYDLFSFMQDALVGGMPHTLTLTELLFQLWFFGAKAFYPVWIPLLLIAVCATGLRILNNHQQTDLETTRT